MNTTASVLAPALCAFALVACKTTGDTSASGHSPSAETPLARPYAGKRLGKPAHLSDEVREAVSQTMRAHGDDMTVLLWSMLFLDLDSATESALSISARPPLTRTGTASELRVPPAIVTLGAELGEKATRLETLARREPRDPEAFARAFGEMTEVCVRCHSLYLYGKHETAEPIATSPR